MTAPKLTEAQRAALDWAQAHGAVFAGRNHARRCTTTEHDVLIVPANVIRALGVRGLLSVSIGPDGGVMGRSVVVIGLTESRRATLAAIDALHGRDDWWLYNNEHIVWLQSAGLVANARITDAGRAALRESTELRAVSGDIAAQREIVADEQDTHEFEAGRAALRGES